MNRRQHVSVLSRILRDVGLGVCIISVACLLAFYEIKSGRRLPFRWIEFIGLTPIVFWVVMKPLRKHWHRFRFWFTASALLLVHTLAFTAVLMNCPWWPGVWFIPVFMVEAPLLFLALDKFGAHHAEHR